MNALKWFFVIFFAVFFANIASNFATIALSLAGTKAAIQSLLPQTSKPASVRVAHPLKPGESPREALCTSWQTLYRDNPKTPYLQQMELACKSVHGDDWIYSPNP